MSGKRESILHYSLIFALAYCGAIAFTMRFKMPELTEAQTINALSEIVWNFKSSLNGTSVVSTILFAAFSALGIFVLRQKEDKGPGKLLLFVSFAIALVWLAGVSFSIDNTLESLDKSPGQIVKSVCYTLGITYPLYEGSRLLFLYLERFGKQERINYLGERKGLPRFYHAHPFAVSFFAILLCWLPYVVIAYPGYTSWDGWAQLAYYYKTIPFTTHHSPAYTLYLGWVIELGRCLGNGNVGLYLALLGQVMAGALVFSYGLYLMKEKWNTPLWLRIAGFLLVWLCPYMIGYIIVVMKDAVYAIFLTLFVLELLCMLDKGFSYFEQWKHWILLAVSIIGTILLRKNGTYVLYPCIALLLIYFGFMTKRSGKDKKTLVKIMVAFLAPILMASLFTTAIIEHYGITEGSIKEAFSFPFQQTARYVLECGDEVTEEEKEAISAVLDYEHLAESYDPRISDPVKRLYKEDATKGDLLRYFVVWFKQFLKHPEIYIKATVNQNYYLLYPMLENNALWAETLGTNPFIEDVNLILNIHEIETLKGAQAAMGGFYKSMYSLPVIGFFSHQAPYNLLLIYLFVYAWYKKRYAWMLAAVPLVMSDIVILLAPVIQGHPRYAFPIIYAMPVMTAYYMYLVKQKP